MAKLENFISLKAAVYSWFVLVDTLLANGDNTFRQKVDHIWRFFFFNSCSLFID